MNQLSLFIEIVDGCPV